MNKKGLSKINKLVKTRGTHGVACGWPAEVGSG